MNIAIHDIVGATGVAIIVFTYLLLQLERLESTSLTYSTTNGVGAAMILYSLWFEFNFAAFLVEFFWLIISIIGIVRFVQRRRTKGAAQ